MKKTIGSKEYDTEKCVEIISTEALYCVKYNGFNFEYATLCITGYGEFFIHGKGPLGCNSIVPMSMISATNWLKEACDHEGSHTLEKVFEFVEKQLHDKELIGVRIMNVLCLLSTG